jgi:transposase
LRANASGYKASGNTPLYRRLLHYYNMERDAFLARYHQRSNVESTFSMMRRRFGGALRSKGRVAQSKAALCNILCHNVFCISQSMHELRIAPTFWRAQ